MEEEKGMHSTFIVTSFKANIDCRGIHLSMRTQNGLLIKIPYIQGEEILK